MENVRNTLYRRPGSDQLENIEAALKENPEDPTLWEWYGFTLYGLDRFPEAVESYQRALQLNPHSPASHYYLGNALSSLGRVDEALTHWKRVVALKPEGREGRRAREKLIKHDPGFETEAAHPEEASPTESQAEEMARLGELVKQEKMEALAGMAQGICHELNNPLMVVTGFADLLVSRLVTDDPRLKAMPEKIREAGRRCVEVIRRFSNFANRVGHENSREIDVSELIEEVLGILGAACRSQGIQVVTKLEMGLFIRNSQPTALQLGLMSLLDNARQAMPHGGLLEVTANRDGAWAAISIRDNGVGMDEKEIAHIFEPFNTRKKTWSSLGLGLAETYATVQRHQGTISCESSEGQGTTFHVRVPLAPDTAVVHDDATLPTRTNQSRSVLVVDEDYDLMYLVARILERDGCKATLTTDGEAALTNLIAGQYGLVIVDPLVWGPFMGDRLRTIRAKDPNLPVLMTLGVASPLDKSLLSTMGSLRILQKPYSFDDLARVVQRLMSGDASGAPARPAPSV